jgi:transcription antitermination factor NusG
MGYWSVARIENRREALALGCLALAGYSSYYPKLREVRRLSGGRKVEIVAPLFLGYAFVTIEDQWHAARWSPGVLGLLMSGDRPARVPDGTVEALQDRERQGVVWLPTKAAFAKGDAIRVTDGPLMGLLGLFEGMRSGDRVAVLIAFMGGNQRVTLPATSVTAA